MNLLVCVKSFLAVANHGGFASASRQVYISPANLHRQVKYLEEWVGGQLFLASTRKMELSEFGQSYYPIAKQFLRQAEEMKSFSSRSVQKPQGFLRISVPPKFGKIFLMEKIDWFVRSHPEVCVDVQTAHMRGGAFYSDIDVVISDIDANSAEFSKRLILQDERCISAAPRYLEQHGTPEIPEDLAQHACLINTRQVSQNRWIFNQDLLVKVNGVFFSNSNELLVDAAERGIGILCSSKFIVNDSHNSKSLVPILSEYKMSQRNFFAYGRKDPEKLFLIQSFIDSIALK